MVFEQLGNLITSIDILGYGILIPLLGLDTGIAMLISNNELMDFLINMYIMLVIEALGIFFLTKESGYLMIAVIVVIIWIITPGKPEPKEKQ